jgi:hypothetical protein
MTSPGIPPDRPGAPSDMTTLAEVIADYEGAGFTGQFALDDDGCVTGAGAAPLDPETLELVSLRRLEGASDPADMAAVAAVRTADGQQGLLVLRYGPEASAEEAKVLRAFTDHRGQGLPPASAPGESSH